MRITRKYMNRLAYQEQLALVKKDGLLIQLINNQTEEICRAAVRQNGNALCWVKDIKLNILLELIRSWENLSSDYINLYKTAKAKMEAKPDFLDSTLAECVPRIKGWLDTYGYTKDISAYSGLSGKDLRSLHDRLKKKYAQLFNNENLGIKERLERVDAAIRAKKNTKSKVLLKEFMREWLTRQLHAVSILIYHSMNRRGDTGDVGKDSLYMGLFRNIMHISDDAVIMPSDLLFFDIILLQCDSANGSKSGEEYFALTRDLSLELFGRFMNKNEISEVVTFLEPDRIIFSEDRNGLKFLFARVEEQIVDGTTIRKFQKEYARSPQFTLSNAGWANKDTITIRKTALSVLFNVKWKAYLRETPFRKEYSYGEINTAISDGIRWKTMVLYCREHNIDDVIAESGLLIREMEAGVIAHEFAHLRVDALLKPQHEHIRGAFCLDGDNALYAIKEGEADWNGAIPWFISIAEEKGSKAGARLAWGYLSDNWFLCDDDDDDEDQYFTLMAKVLIGLLLPFINVDGLPDFSALAARRDLICKQLSTRMEKIILRLLHLIEVSDYRILDYNFNYQRLEDELFELFKEDKSGYTREQLKNDSDYWQTVQKVLKFFSLGGKREMEKILAEEAADLEAFVLEIAGAGPDITLLEYIYGRFAELGIYKLKDTKVTHPVFEYGGI